MPQLPGFQGLRSLGDWAGPNRSWTPTALGPETWTPSILWWGLGSQWSLLGRSVQRPS